MRTVFLIIFTLNFSILFSQKYILLDSLKTKFPIKEYTLNTKDIYDINEEINVYNVYLSKNTILLLSVLPEATKVFAKEGITNYNNLEKKIVSNKKNSNSWTLIDFDKIKTNILSSSKILDIATDWMENNSLSNKTFEYKILKKENGNYYVSKNCFTEFFYIADIRSPLITPLGVINVSEPKVTIKQMEEVFKKQYPKEPFPLDTRERVRSKNLNVIYSVHNYLSKEYLIKGNKAYQFWTLDGWWYHDGLNEYRGIDRFVYIPEKGIVGGSYDFYFRYEKGYGISSIILWDNIINEKVMIAEELK
ncbi:hypothetical protein HZQ19_02535 [Elizabethkingia anophelis]|uniref:hypothetical protein n=1 Tax=Elizabethkingia anophelis TaxID=1117645 RepID=UPI0015E0C282|nr:hypothetical protein [Elizabethkingia anophelis]MCT3760644.1 hypothetical protein [Elizabethkingia anophelis]MCT3971789.1 hypothetical protein [Elizabethkingia anophelis]MCT4000254.1 hypothetical protein [Elizabethkingia anophelis]MCT4014765.1 hypothetical protein [Elizabethkingia anophelis]MCT4018326.1 hypothetical protein [Elizabethkingia anophelis]